MLGCLNLILQRGLEFYRVLAVSGGKSPVLLALNARVSSFLSDLKNDGDKEINCSPKHCSCRNMSSSDDLLWQAQA